MIKILYENDNPLENEEAKAKGYREDVLVFIDNRKYRISVYSLERLVQDVMHEQEMYSYFQMPNNLVIVSDIKYEQIMFTVEKLVRGGYFESLKAME